MLIDENMKWESHIRAVENTVSRNIGVISRAKHILDSEHLLLLYHALIQPFLSYALQVWGSTYHTKFNRLIILQKRIVRIIDHAEYLAHTSPLFQKYRILKFVDLTKYVQMNVLHAFLCNRLPLPLSDKIILENPLRPLRAVRDPRHFCVPFTVPNYRKFSLFNSAPDNWNTLVSTKIKNIDDIPRNFVFFKKVIRKLFTDDY